MVLLNQVNKKESNITPLTIVVSVADKAKIEPNTGPIQGVHPKANAEPTTKGKTKLSL